MNIVLIGSGNVAWHIGKRCIKAGHIISQIISRNATTATNLAYEVDTESANYFSIIHQDADLYIICVNDDSIASIVAQLPKLKSLVVHTSGTLSAEVLLPISNHVGVMYPLQSLIYGTNDMPEIPFLVQSNNEIAQKQIIAFANTISNQVQVVTANSKMALHIAAVFVNNFTHHLYVQAQNWCVQNQIDFNLLLPLISESTHRLITFCNAQPNTDISSLQTGPASRNDKETIAKHLSLLENQDQLSKLYLLFTEFIQNKLNKK
jgi:predicted short-subunit dehydrogenase-like oxidoreductase (DUF2520 family)